MKNKVYAFTGFLFVTVALYAYWQVAYAIPYKIETYIQGTLQEISRADYFEYGDKEIGATQLSLREIKLDKDGFSRIEQINIRYSPLSFFLTGRLSEIDILVPDITLSIRESAIHEYVKQFLASPVPQWMYAIDTLSIEGGRINFLTENMGALRFGVEGISRTNSSGKSVQMQVSAAQKQFSGDIKLSGTLHPNRNWHIDAIIEDGRLDHDLLQLTRMTGQITLDSAGDDGYFAKSEMSVGGLRASGGHAISDIAASYELDQRGYSFVAAGKALGFDNIDLGFAYNSDQPDIITGTIFTPSLAELARYYNKERDMFVDVDRDRMLQNIFLTYELSKDQLWSEKKQVLLRFNQLDINDFNPVFNGDFYGNGALRGALKVKISPEEVIFGGLALSGKNGNFVFEKSLLKHLSQKIRGNPRGDLFLRQAEDFHYETLSVAITGAKSENAYRQITIDVFGGRNDTEAENFTFVYDDDLLWFWSALLGNL